MILTGPFQLEVFYDFPRFPVCHLLQPSGAITGWGFGGWFPHPSWAFHRILEWFGLEGTFKGHLVQLPTPFPRCDVSSTSSPTPDQPSLWLGSVSTRIKLSETMYLHVLADV